MKRSVFSMFMISLILTYAASAIAASAPAPISTPEIKAAASSGKKSFLFFMNPAGRPCGAQNEILQKLQKDRKGNFNIVYISTQRQEDQKAFYDYGVRSLPWVIMLDTKGRIGHHFPPGIQSYEALAQALDKSN